jgi:hypothetical protein
LEKLHRRVSLDAILRMRSHLSGSSADDRRRLRGRTLVQSS